GGRVPGRPPTPTHRRPPSTHFWAESEGPAMRTRTARAYSAASVAQRSGGLSCHLVDDRRLGTLLEEQADPGGPGDVRRHLVETLTGFELTHGDPFAVGLDLDLTCAGTHDTHRTQILRFGEAVGDEGALAGRLGGA